MEVFHNQYKHDYQPLLQDHLEAAIQLFFQAMGENYAKGPQH